MTKTQELLDAVRVKLGGITDYKIAQVMGLPRQTISHYRQGTRQADSYAATRIAMALDMDPLEVIASIEAEAARSTTARDFWRSFTSGQLPNTIGAVFLAMSSFFADAPTAKAATESGSHNGRLRQKPRHEKSPGFRGFFFVCQVQRPSVIVAGRDDRPKRSYITPEDRLRNPRLGRRAKTAHQRA